MPGRAATSINNVVVFDGAIAPIATATVDFASPQTIGQLIIRDGATVALSTIANRTLSIGNGSTTGPDLTITAGSDLTLTNPGITETGLVLQLDISATAAIAGAFSSGMAGAGGAFVAGSLTSGAFIPFSDFALASTDASYVPNPCP